MEVRVGGDADGVLGCGSGSSSGILVFVRAGEIIVDDNVHLGNVDTTSANVGGHQNLDLVGLEFVVRFSAAKAR